MDFILRGTHINLYDHILVNSYVYLLVLWAIYFESYIPYYEDTALLNIQTLYTFYMSWFYKTSPVLLYFLNHDHGSTYRSIRYKTETSCAEINPLIS